MFKQWQIQKNGHNNSIKSIKSKFSNASNGSHKYNFHKLDEMLGSDNKSNLSSRLSKTGQPQTLMKNIFNMDRTTSHNSNTSNEMYKFSKML
jgi:hypothetical protein